MKNFYRSNQLLSLCGLNCGLCPMFLDKHCLGCGNGNQSCKIAKCSLAHDKIAYCYECEEYLCEKFNGIDEYDSFITHRKQKDDLEKAKLIGIEQYNNEQIAKMEILTTLLNNYNDGRKKTFYCVAVNVLELSELETILLSLSKNDAFEALDYNGKCKYVYDLFVDVAKKRDINYKLRRKK